MFRTFHVSTWTLKTFLIAGHFCLEPFYCVGYSSPGKKRDEVGRPKRRHQHERLMPRFVEYFVLVGFRQYHHRVADSTLPQASQKYLCADFKYTFACSKPKRNNRWAFFFFTNYFSINTNKKKTGGKTPIFTDKHVINKARISIQSAFQQTHFKSDVFMLHFSAIVLLVSTRVFVRHAIINYLNLPNSIEYILKIFNKAIMNKLEIILQKINCD